MSFLDLEFSLFRGRPIRLYEFRRGAIRWRYTNADRDITYQLATYEKTAIADDGIRRTGETTSETMKIHVPWNNPVARLYRGVPPAAEVSVIIRDIQYGEAGHRVAWSGLVQGVKWPSPERAELICQTIGASMDRPGLSLSWDRGCPYAVFDADCGLNPADFETVATIDSLTTSSITSATFDALDDGYFAGGWVEWDIGSGEVETRGITRHVGGQLTLLGGTDGLLAGMQVRAYPGCPRTIQACETIFNNRANYGGFPHLPGKSPFDGDPIFW